MKKNKIAILIFMLYSISSYADKNATLGKEQYNKYYYPGIEVYKEGTPPNSPEQIKWISFSKVKGININPEVLNLDPIKGDNIIYVKDGITSAIKLFDSDITLSNVHTTTTTAAYKGPSRRINKNDGVQNFEMSGNSKISIGEESEHRNYGGRLILVKSGESNIDIKGSRLESDNIGIQIVPDPNNNTNLSVDMSESMISGGHSLIFINETKNKSTKATEKKYTKATLNLSESQLNGSVDIENGNAEVTINLSKTSAWYAVNHSNLTKLKINDSLIDLKSSTTVTHSDFAILNVNELSGNEGTYNFYVNMAVQNSSKLIINKTSTGKHIAQVVNGLETSTTGKEKNHAD